MSYFDKDSLAAFYQKESFIIKNDDVTGREKLIGMVDGMILGKTGIETPENPDYPLLEQIGCMLFVYFAAGKQGELSSDERMRREKLYNDAIALLDQIKDGSLKVYDSEGEEVEVPSKPEVAFTSTRIIKRL